MLTSRSTQENCFAIFRDVFFVSKSLFELRDKNTKKPLSHARMLIYRTWPIGKDEKSKERNTPCIFICTNSSARSEFYSF